MYLLSMKRRFDVGESCIVGVCVLLDKREWTKISLVICVAGIVFALWKVVSNGCI